MNLGSNAQLNLFESEIKFTAQIDGWLESFVFTFSLFQIQMNS